MAVPGTAAAAGDADPCAAGVVLAVGPLDLALRVQLAAALGISHAAIYQWERVPADRVRQSRGRQVNEHRGRDLNRQEHAAAEDSMKWAARTYVVAAVGSLATLLYFLSIYLGGRD